MTEQTHDQLAALYEQLADARATQDGLRAEQVGQMSGREYDDFLEYGKSLDREVEGILEEISALGGEDPEL